MAKINGNEIRPGNVIEHDGGLWVAVKTNAVKPGKGGAYNQVELKNLINGTKLNERFRSDEKVEQIRLDLESIWMEERNTVLFVTHDINEAILLSDRVVVMDKSPGRILEVIPIDLPRPRKMSTIETPEFNAYRKHITEMFTDMGLFRRD